MNTIIEVKKLSDINSDIELIINRLYEVDGQSEAIDTLLEAVEIINEVIAEKNKTDKS